MGLGAVARVVAGPEEAEGLAADAAVARPGAEVVPAAVVAAPAVKVAPAAVVVAVPAVKAAPAAVVAAVRRAVQVEEELPGPALAVAQGVLTRVNPPALLNVITRWLPL